MTVSMAFGTVKYKRNSLLQWCCSWSKAAFEQSILIIIQRSSVVMSNLQSCIKLMKYSFSFIFGLFNFSSLFIIPKNKNISNISMDFWKTSFKIPRSIGKW